MGIRCRRWRLLSLPVRSRERPSFHSEEAAQGHAYQRKGHARWLGSGTADGHVIQPDVTRRIVQGASGGVVIRRGSGVVGRDDPDAEVRIVVNPKDRAEVDAVAIVPDTARDGVAEQ